MRAARLSLNNKVYLFVWLQKENEKGKTTHVQRVSPNRRHACVGWYC